MAEQPIPIFVISFNRLGVLKRSIASFRHQSRPIDLVIHDNGSSFEPLLAYLKELEAEGATVIHAGKKVSQQDDLNSIADTVKAYFETHPACNYVVTDPDIELAAEAPDMLEMCEFVLRSSRPIDAVAPMLRIDDIPDFYPMKDEVIDRHTKKFWSKTPSSFTWRGQEVKFILSRVDTTFAMHRAGVPFERWVMAIRTYAPYWARHLDWYIDTKNLTEDQTAYLETASTVSYWGGPLLKRFIERFGGDPALRKMSKR